MNILIASPIDGGAVRQLRSTNDVVCAFDATEADLKALVRDRDVLIFRSGVDVTAAVMREAPRLELLVRAGSGLDNLDVGFVRKNGIKLVRIQRPGARAVAELAFCFMLMLSRRVMLADAEFRRGHWAKHQLVGYLLKGKRLGIIGAGNIGATVGQMGAQWGMEVIGCIEHPFSGAAAARLAAKGIRLADFDEVIDTADYLSIHVPLQASTRGLVGAEAISRMKERAFLVNLSRGHVVDEEALAQALLGDNGLAGAALDVHEQEGEGVISPLAGMDNVILTPHVGASTIDSQREIGELIVAAVDDHIRASGGTSGAAHDLVVE
jgi:phosphoglycerate dehydrogenase-like enzyme